MKNEIIEIEGLYQQLLDRVEDLRSDLEQGEYYEEAWRLMAMLKSETRDERFEAVMGDLSGLKQRAEEIAEGLPDYARAKMANSVAVCLIVVTAEMFNREREVA